VNVVQHFYGEVTFLCFIVGTQAFRILETEHWKSYEELNNEESDSLREEVIEALEEFKLRYGSVSPHPPSPPPSMLVCWAWSQHLLFLQGDSPLINSHILDSQLDDFIVVMSSRTADSTKLAWQSILQNKFLAREISQFCILAQIFMCIPIGSVQNERAFSQMNLIKSDLRNSLKEKHLNVAMRVRRSNHTLATLPVERIVQKWLDDKSRRGVLRVA
jgi:hypothetical protein